MPLEEYKKKRKFDETPEPTGGSNGDDSLKFVVQKHSASHLHYDFRLELKGVLKSWAVPKGPSLDPDEPRLAMQTEDHPYDYLHFEGIIPKRQYGGGTVIVWDQGTYQTFEIQEKDKKSQEHSIMGQFFKGGILFSLNGQKLKGKFALIKDPNKDKEDRSWYLMKVKDKHTSKKDITSKNRSVLSGMSIEEMAENPNAKQWQSNRKEKETKADPIPPQSKVKDLVSRLIVKGMKSEMPLTFKPMLCERIYNPFDGQEWLFELKLDGYRVVAHVQQAAVVLRTRELQDYSGRYNIVVEDLKKLNHEAVLDGEVVAYDDNGRPDFSLLQNYKGQVRLHYNVFDIVWADGYDLTQLMLIERKEILKTILPSLETVKYLDHVIGHGIDFFELVKDKGLEGIVAKKADSLYYENTRSKSWLKLPIEEFVEYVIVGYTESEHGRPFSRIMFGEYRGGELFYVYHTGGGISDKLLYSTYNALKKIEIPKKPIVNDVVEETPIHWVKPTLVGRFKEKKLAKTKSGKIRHPVIFLGIREDLSPKDIVSEESLDNAKEPEEVPQKPPKSRGKKKTQFDEIEIWKQIHPNEEITETDTIEVEGKQIQVINYKKEYWPGLRKEHVLVYYQTMADYILPHLQDRPLGLNVVTEWAGGETSFIRNMKGFYPEWVKTYTTQRKVAAKGKSEEIDWVLCNDLPTLLYLVNLGTVDFHPWAARTQSADFPDYIIIDLDPDKNISTYVPQLIKIAKATKKILDRHKLISFVKTSGKRGLHILIPCHGISYLQATTTAERLAKEINAMTSEITTLERSKEHRGDLIYIDAYQNNYSDRLASVYSVRAYKQPTVSTPLYWKDVNERADFKSYNIDTIEKIKTQSAAFDGLNDTRNADLNSKFLEKLI